MLNQCLFQSYYGVKHHKKLKILPKMVEYMWSLYLKYKNFTLQVYFPLILLLFN